MRRCFFSKKHYFSVGYWAYISKLCPLILNYKLCKRRIENTKISIENKANPYRI